MTGMTPELDKAFDQEYAKYQFERTLIQVTRNQTLEEVAREFDKMPFGDTSASFAIFVRNMKT